MCVCVFMHWRKFDGSSLPVNEFALPLINTLINIYNLHMGGSRRKFGGSLWLGSCRSSIGVFAAAHILNNTRAVKSMNILLFLFFLLCPWVPYHAALEGGLGLECCPAKPQYRQLRSSRRDPLCGKHEIKLPAPGCTQKYSCIPNKPSKAT